MAEAAAASTYNAWSGLVMLLVAIGIMVACYWYGPRVLRVWSLAGVAVCVAGGALRVLALTNGA